MLTGRKTAIALLGIALIVAVAVAGCSSGKGTSAATATPVASATASASSASGSSCCGGLGNTSSTDESSGCSDMSNNSAGTGSTTATQGTCNKSLPDVPGYGITITGGKTSPVTLTYADLTAMDFVDTGNVSEMKMSGSGVEMTADFIGVPMTSILAKAGVPDGNVTFRITASDGYSMDYTRDQLDNAILGLVKDGTPLVSEVENKSAIVMVMPGQRGPMWIRVPTGIEITKE